jgi:small redox-active disulfide protein 2
MKVEILGVGCAKCNKLYELTQKVLEDEGIEAELVKVDQLDEILRHGVMMVPGLVIDGAVKSSGAVPKPDKLAAWLREAAHR